MKKTIINRMENFFMRVWAVALIAIFSNKVLAQGFQTEYGVPIQTKYGVPLDQPLYGVPQPLYGVQPIITPKPTPADFHDIPVPMYGMPVVPDTLTFEKVLVYIIVPVVILIVFIVGTVVYLKRKKKNENIEKDI